MGAGVWVPTGAHWEPVKISQEHLLEVEYPERDQLPSFSSKLPDEGKSFPKHSVAAVKLR